MPDPAVHLLASCCRKWPLIWQPVRLRTLCFHVLLTPQSSGQISGITSAQSSPQCMLLASQFSSSFNLPVSQPGHSSDVLQADAWGIQPERLSCDSICALPKPRTVPETRPCQNAAQSSSSMRKRNRTDPHGLVLPSLQVLGMSSTGGKDWEEAPTCAKSADAFVSACLNRGNERWQLLCRYGGLSIR